MLPCEMKKKGIAESKLQVRGGGWRECKTFGDQILAGQCPAPLTLSGISDLFCI